MGSSFWFLLPERFNNKLAVHLGFLEDVINGSLCSVVTFVNEDFFGPLVNLSDSHIARSGGIFITVMKSFLAINVFSSKSEETESEVKVVFDLAMCFTFRSKPSNCRFSHAIVLCIINRAPVLV